jgi:hypothetical protein
VELPNGVRPFVLALYFLVASVLLYFGIAIPMIAPGGYHESRFELAIPYLLFVLPGLLVTFRNRMGAPSTRIARIEGSPAVVDSST